MHTTVGLSLFEELARDLAELGAVPRGTVRAAASGGLEGSLLSLQFADDACGCTEL